MEVEESNEAHPIETANIFSRMFFSWIYPVLAKGQKVDLKEKDLYRHPKEDDSESLGDCLQNEWNKELKKKNPSLLKALIRIFGCKYLLICPLPFIQECLVIVSQAYLLGIVIDYFDNKIEENTLIAYLSSASICLLSASIAFTLHGYYFGAQRLGMKMRIACCSIIYRKALRLSHSSIGQSSIGQMVNLLSNDVNRFDFSVYSLPYLVVGPLQVIITVLMFWEILGYSLLVGVSVLWLYAPVQIAFGKLISKLRGIQYYFSEFVTKSKSVIIQITEWLLLSSAKLTDKRMQLLKEVTASMRVIKMYTWELAFASLIELARKEEIKKIKNVFICRGISFAMGYTLSKLIVFFSFLTFWFNGGQLTAKIVFVTITISINLYLSTLYFIPQAINQIAEVLISIKRLQKFLLLEERDTIIDVEDSRPPLDDCGIWMKNICASWNKDAELTLKGISLEVRHGDLLAIVGSVGSGKTSLLMSMLGEIPISSGEMKIKGKIAYTSQEPWIFNGTIRQNILFGDVYQENKYKEVLHVSALEKDISHFPDGDLTLVGERGTAMSGGQKARINLARALYLDADIFIFDDPLSAVDAHVANHIFKKCIMEHLKNKIRILVTHHIQFLKSATKIIVLKEGKCEAVGDFNEVMEKELQKEIFSEEEEIKYVESELNAKNKSFVGNEISDYMQNNFSQNKENSMLQLIPKNEDGKHIENKFKKDKQTIPRTVGIGVYKEYANNGSGTFVQIIILILFIVVQTLSIGSDYWLVKWTNEKRSYFDNEETSRNFTMRNFTDNIINMAAPREQFYIYVYSGFICTLCVLSLICVMSFYVVCMKASINLHNNMLHCIIRTPISFLDSNPIGKVLNRFSIDMGVIDDLLPVTSYDAFYRTFFMIGMFVIEAVLNPYLLIPTVLLFTAVYFLWRYYIKVAKNIKHLEGTTRSPVFTHLSTSLYGLATIRAFKAERIFKVAFDKYLNKHTSSWLLFLVLTRWIGINTHMLCVLNLTIVFVSSLFLVNSTITGGEFGIIITYGLIIFTISQWVVRQYAELDNQMTSVERILDYSKLSPEANYISSSGSGPPETWPEKGKIEFRNVSLQYSQNKYPVLKNICFHIKAQEKIGIVGRTGAGKSSIIAALFRMTEPTGIIIIDGIITRDIGLHDLRSKISIIPQDPLLFTGSLRRNVDPFNEHPEETLWKVLEEVHLKNVVRELSGGLDTELSEGGSNFSVGQRQLICLARAILRQNKILVLDEATSNMDKNTDSFIQKTIREKFDSCTVITVAHRLQTIIDSDRVMVLEAGKIEEFDEPYNLLKKKNGIFYNMVLMTGETMMKELHCIAKETYHTKHKFEITQ